MKFVLAKSLKTKQNMNPDKIFKYEVYFKTKF